MAIDNNDRNDEEVGRLHMRHWIDPPQAHSSSPCVGPAQAHSWWCASSPRPAEGLGLHKEDYIRPPILRSHFPKPGFPVPFPTVFRHLHCNSSIYFICTVLLRSHLVLIMLKYIRWLGLQMVSWPWISF